MSEENKNVSMLRRAFLKNGELGYNIIKFFWGMFYKRKLYSWAELDKCSKNVMSSLMIVEDFVILGKLLLCTYSQESQPEFFDFKAPKNAVRRYC